MSDTTALRARLQWIADRMSKSGWAADEAIVREAIAALAPAVEWANYLTTVEWDSVTSDTTSRPAAAPAPEGLDVDQLVENLFTNGLGDKADRLVLTAADGRDLGGWSRRPVRDRIADALRARPALSDETLREMAQEHLRKRQMPWCWTPGIRQRSDEEFMVVFARAVLARQQEASTTKVVRP